MVFLGLAYLHSYSLWICWEWLLDSYSNLKICWWLRQGIELESKDVKHGLSQANKLKRKESDTSNGKWMKQNQSSKNQDMEEIK